MRKAPKPAIDLETVACRVIGSQIIVDTPKQIAKLHRKLAKHYADWIAMPYVLEAFRDDPPKFFAAYLLTRH